MYNPGVLVAIVFGVAYCLICGAISDDISRRRGMGMGLTWGLTLGIIGIIVVAIRPNDELIEDLIDRVKVIDHTLKRAERHADRDQEEDWPSLPPARKE